MRKYIAMLFIGLAIIGLGYTLACTAPSMQAQSVEVEVSELSCPDGYKADTYSGFDAEYTIGTCVHVGEYTKGEFDPITHVEVVCYAPVGMSEARSMYVAVDGDGYMRCHSGVEMGYVPA